MVIMNFLIKKRYIKFLIDWVSAKSFSSNIPFGGLGHGKSLQVAISVSTCSSPTAVISSEEVQLDPPYSGEGSEHDRVLSCVPPPQLFEHSVDGSHSPQFPSTKKLILFIKRGQFV